MLELEPVVHFALVFGLVFVHFAEASWCSSVDTSLCSIRARSIVSKSSWAGDEGQGMGRGGMGGGRWSCPHAANGTAIYADQLGWCQRGQLIGIYGSPIGRVCVVSFSASCLVVPRGLSRYDQVGLKVCLPGRNGAGRKGGAGLPVCKDNGISMSGHIGFLVPCH